MSILRSIKKWRIAMLDSVSQAATMQRARREDRAMLRSNPSARPGPKHGRESPVHGGSRQLLPPTPCFGPKAINLHPPFYPFYPSIGSPGKHMSGCTGLFYFRPIPGSLVLAPARSQPRRRWPSPRKPKRATIFISTTSAISSAQEWGEGRANERFCPLNPHREPHN